MRSLVEKKKKMPTIAEEKEELPMKESDEADWGSASDDEETMDIDYSI